MPKPFVYKNGQVVMLRVTVVNDADRGYPIVNLGGLEMPLPQMHLDKADVRPDSDRDMTDEERDRDDHARAEAATKAEASRIAKAKAAADEKAAAEKAADRTPSDSIQGA